MTAIWVAEGVYKPVYDTNDSSYKYETFNLLEDVGEVGQISIGTEQINDSKYQAVETVHSMTVPAKMKKDVATKDQYLFSK